MSRVNMMDRELPEHVIRNARLRKAAIAVLVVSVPVTAIYLLRIFISPVLDRNQIRTSIVERGSIEATVSASGIIVPEKEQVITSPINSVIEEVYFYSGDRVAAGQSIVKMDKTSLEMTRKKLDDELAFQKSSKRQVELELRQKQVDMQTSYDVKRLQTQFIESQYKRMARLHEIGGVTDEDLDRAALNVDIAKLELQQLENQIDNYRAALAAELEGLDLQIRIQENRIAEVTRELMLADARAGYEGIITWVNHNIGSPIAQGDIIARIADLRSYRLEARISDVHAEKLHVGGKVTLRIGEKLLTGRIGSIRPTVQDGVVTFICTLDDKRDPVLRPNLRADVFVVTSGTRDVLRVENGPFYSGISDQKIFVIKDDKAVRTTVSIGVSNYDYVELKGDIAPGDEVIVSDMADYDHMEEIRIREQ